MDDLLNYLKYSMLFALAAMLLVGCGLYGPSYGLGPAPDPKYNFNFAGEWKGSLTEQATDGRTAQVTVSINPHNFSQTIDSNDYSSGYYILRGNWKAEYSAELISVGILEGNADAYIPDFYAELTFGDDPDCAISVQALRIEDTITGTFKPGTQANGYMPVPGNNANCSFTDIKAGNFEIQKQ